MHKMLSESFMNKHKDKLDWVNVFKYQKPSKEFIEKYKVEWDEFNYDK